MPSDRSRCRTPHPHDPTRRSRTRSASRRAFLTAASAGLAGGLAAARGLAQESAPTARVIPTASGSAAPAPAQESAPPAVSTETLAHAERLTGVSFDPARRELMLPAVRTNREHYEALRRVPLAPEIEPALHFHPPAATRIGRPPATRAPLDWPPPAITLGSSPEDLAFASVYELSELLRTRKITSTDLTRLALDRLTRHDPTLHCIVTLTQELALEQAAQADREMQAGQYRGRLHGIPYGLKDLVATRGIRTTWGAKPYEHQIFDYDATVVERLREAGAVLVAKLTTGELAIGDLWFGGRTRNPWNPERGSSGSSAGPAAAVAAGLVPFAIGTETNGSIVSPSSACGVTGLRPTYGRVSRHGVMALRWTLDKVGVIARAAEDAALVLRAVYGPDGRDETVADVAFEWQPGGSLAGLRAGIVEAELARSGVGGSGEERRRGAERAPVLRAAVETLRAAGLTIVPVELPDLPARAMYAVGNAEAGAAFDDLVRSGAVDQLANQGPDGRANQLRWARFVPAVEYLRAQRIRTLLVRAIEAMFSTVDVLVTPSDSASVTMTNFTGHPAVTVPAGLAGGLPVGLMFTGRYYDEATLLRVAWNYQQRTAWHRGRPPVGR